MAEKRKSRRKKEELDEKPSKTEYAVAKYLRSHLVCKKTTLLNHKVEYFVASKAVDCLLDSEWSSGKKSHETLFTTRDSVVHYLHKMLVHKFFHRAKKIPVSHKDSKQKKKVTKIEESNPGDGKDKKTSPKQKTEKSKPNEKNKDGEEKKDSAESGKEKKKEKRKFKLDMHLEQVFVDGNEAFVWIYDPVPTTAWLIGGLLVVGAILLCVFPLWPSSVRKGVYYISIAAAAFLCIIVALIIVRIVIFCVIWVVTFGRHHLWILPNLTEDVGFFESFWPLFKYEYKGKEEEEEKSTETKKLTKDEDEDDDDDQKEAADESEKQEKNEATTERESDHDATDTDRESEESSADREQLACNSGTDNGFEMVNNDELDHEEGS